MKSVAFHGVLALLGLGLAYQTWTREEETEQPAGEVTVIECSDGQVSALSIDTDTNSVTVEPARQGPDQVYWITTKRKPVEPKVQVPESQPAKEPEKDPSKYLPVNFLASEKFSEYMARLSPLRAKRSLGEVADKDMAKFGLDDIKERIALECGGQKLELEIGGQTYGSSNRYVRRAGTREVYLLAGEVTQDLKSARYKFMQTAMHAFKLDEIDEAEVKAQGASRRLLFRDRWIKAQARWVDKAAPDTRNELFGNWFDRVAKLRVLEYLRDGEKPGDNLRRNKGLKGTPGAPVPLMTLEYFLAGKAKGKLEFVRVDVGDTPHFYAKTEATRRWVEVYSSTGRQVDADLPLVVGLEEAPADDGAEPDGPVAPDVPSPTEPPPPDVPDPQGAEPPAP